MRRPLRTLGLFIGLALVSASVSAIEVWHSSTVWVNRGMCSAAFTFDAADGPFKRLRILMQAVDKRGQVQAQDTLAIAALGEDNASRYATAFFEGEALCDPDLSIRILKATAVVDGRSVDLIKTRALSARVFKPYAIKISPSVKVVKE